MPTGTPITTTWTSAAGAQTLSTYWNGTETEAQWAARHLQDLRAAWVTNPPIP